MCLFRYSLSIGLILGFLLSAGCGDGLDRLPTVPVSGKVTFSGKPVPSGSGLFVPVQPGPSAEANLKPDGTFTVRTYDPGDGMIPGEYMVMIQGKMTPDDPQAIQLEAEEARKAPKPAKDEVIPLKYADQKKSGLTATIQKGRDNTLQFDLVP